MKTSEFETAMQAALSEGVPDIYLFRKTAPVFYAAEAIFGGSMVVWGAVGFRNF